MQTQSKENLLIAAGFQVIAPKTAAQQQLLNSLPPDKVTPILHAGKRYYVFPDAAHNQAYVGGPSQYQSYRQLRLNATTCFRTQPTTRPTLVARASTKATGNSDWRISCRTKILKLRR
jgi:hypothetical protein